MEFTKEELLQCIDRELLAEKMAEKLIEGQMDLMYNEFKTETVKAINKSAIEVVETVMKEYDGREKLIYHIRAIINGFSKAEIIKMITSQNSV